VLVFDRIGTGRTEAAARAGRVYFVASCEMTSESLNTSRGLLRARDETR